MQNYLRKGDNRESLGSAIHITESPQIPDLTQTQEPQPQPYPKANGLYPVSLPAGTQHVAEVELPPLRPGDESLRVPVYDSRDVPPRMYQEMVPMIPPEVQAQLHRRGFEVDQQRQYMLIELQDGRRIVLPQDAVKVRYAVQ
jgi:hypothetical protein